MQTGDYITNRWLVDAVMHICESHAIELKTYSDDWIIELRKNDIVARIIGYKFSLNNSASAQLAQDKVGTFQVLQSADIAAVPHILLRTKAGETANYSQWQDVVLKPLTGTSGHMVKAYDSEQSARTVANGSSVEAWTLSPRLNILKETRVILLDGDVLLSYEKRAVATDGLKMFNLSQGAIPLDVDPNEEIIHLAQRAQLILGLRLCAVDIVELETGEEMVMEVNDGLMMEYYSRHSQNNTQRAYAVYDRIIKTMMEL